VQVAAHAATITQLQAKLAEEEAIHAQLQQLTTLQGRAIEQLQAVEQSRLAAVDVLSTAGAATGELQLLRQLPHLAAPAC
jgi:hypothetical protein